MDKFNLDLLNNGKFAEIECVAKYLGKFSRVFTFDRRKIRVEKSNLPKFGFILMTSDNIKDPLITLTGEIPDIVMGDLKMKFDIIFVSRENYRVRANPVEILSLMGKFGYTVVENSALNMNNEQIYASYVWTLQRTIQ